MTDEMKIGDYVEVDLGMGLGAIGQIITEHAMRESWRDHGFSNDGLYNAINVMRTSANVKTYKIKFNDGSTHTAYPEECRKLTGKELFKAKLSDDKRIYEI